MKNNPHKSWLYTEEIFKGFIIEFQVPFRATFIVFKVVSVSSSSSWLKQYGIFLRRVKRNKWMKRNESFKWVLFSSVKLGDQKRSVCTKNYTNYTNARHMPRSLQSTRNKKNPLCIVMYTYIHLSFLLSPPSVTAALDFFCFSQNYGIELFFFTDWVVVRVSHPCISLMNKWEITAGAEWEGKKKRNNHGDILLLYNLGFS